MTDSNWIAVEESILSSYKSLYAKPFHMLQQAAVKMNKDHPQGRGEFQIEDPRACNTRYTFHLNHLPRDLAMDAVDQLHHVFISKLWRAKQVEELEAIAASSLTDPNMIHSLKFSIGFYGSIDLYTGFSGTVELNAAKKSDRGVVLQSNYKMWQNQASKAKGKVMYQIST